MLPLAHACGVKRLTRLSEINMHVQIILNRLKQNFKEVPVTGPHMASVWSAEVHGLLTQAFPHSPNSAVEVTKLMGLAFPA